MTITIDLLPEENDPPGGGGAAQWPSHWRHTSKAALPRTHAPRKHRITELRGLGQELWQGVDVREYLDELRDDREY